MFGMKHMAIGAVISFLAGMAFRWWKKNSAEIRAEGIALDDKVEAWTKNKWNFEFPDQVHLVWDYIINTVVDFADKRLMSVQGWKDFISFVYNRDPKKLVIELTAQAQKLIEEFKAEDFAWVADLDFNLPLEPQIPDKYKVLVNLFKKNEAARIAGSKMKSVQLLADNAGKVEITPEVAAAVIDASATANKVNEVPEVITKERLLEEIEKCRARKAALVKP